MKKTIRWLLIGLVAYFWYITPATDADTEICRYSFAQVVRLPESPSNSTPSKHYFGQIYLKGNLLKVSQMKLQASDIKHQNPDIDFKVLLVPINFEEETDFETTLAPMLTQTESILQHFGLNLDLVYLNHSFPIPVYYNDHDSVTTAFLFFGNVFDDLALSIAMEETKFQPDIFVYYVHSPEMLGSTATDATHSTVTTGPPYNIYPLLHEVGHNLGLSDGYKRLYTYHLIKNNYNTELFLDPNYLPEMVTTVFVCHGQSVYSPKGSPRSVMTNSYVDSLLIVEGQVQDFIFTPRQVDLMEQYLSQ